MKKSEEESLSVQGVCLCVELSCGCGRSAFNITMDLDLNAKEKPLDAHKIN